MEARRLASHWDAQEEYEVGGDGDDLALDQLEWGADDDVEEETHAPKRAPARAAKKKKDSRSTTTGKKRGQDATAKGGTKRLRPEEAAALVAQLPTVPSISMPPIKNKMKRQEVYRRLKKRHKRLKAKVKQRRKELEAELGQKLPPTRQQRTLDNTREADVTTVQQGDKEVEEDKEVDEFADFFDGKEPRILMTTSEHPTKYMRPVIADVVNLFPHSKYYERGTYELAKITKWAIKRQFTDVMVWREDRQTKTLHELMVIHLPAGPTALFRVTNFVLAKSIPGHGKPTGHYPEVITNQFTTRLGHTVSRMLKALFPLKPDFEGRSAVTFHNQRDFIFIRRHRYIFDDTETARLQELGPRFTLKLKWLQRGIFEGRQRGYDTAEYVWYHRSDLDTSRRRFFL